jgi:SHS2 domain-containing protein
MSQPETAGYEYFEVEADVGVQAWGSTLPEAFAQAALAVLALGVEPDGVAEREVREVRGQGHSSETVLVDWLNQCLYVHEIEGFAVRRVEVDTLSTDLVHGFLHGEELDRNRHRLGTVVKAATLHEVAVREAPGRAEVRVIVDV